MARLANFLYIGGRIRGKWKERKIQIKHLLLFQYEMKNNRNNQLNNYYHET